MKKIFMLLSVFTIVTTVYSSLNDLRNEYKTEFDQFDNTFRDVANQIHNATTKAQVRDAINESLAGSYNTLRVADINAPAVAAKTKKIEDSAPDYKTIGNIELTEGFTLSSLAGFCENAKRVKTDHTQTIGVGANKAATDLVLNAPFVTYFNDKKAPIFAFIRAMASDDKKYEQLQRKFWVFSTFLKKVKTATVGAPGAGNLTTDSLAAAVNTFLNPGGAPELGLADVCSLLNLLTCYSTDIARSNPADDTAVDLFNSVDFARFRNANIAADAVGTTPAKNQLLTTTIDFMGADGFGIGLGVAQNTTVFNNDAGVNLFEHVVMPVCAVADTRLVYFGLDLVQLMFGQDFPTPKFVSTALVAQHINPGVLNPAEACTLVSPGNHQHIGARLTNAPTGGGGVDTLDNNIQLNAAVARAMTGTRAHGAANAAANPFETLPGNITAVGTALPGGVYGYLWGGFTGVGGLNETDFAASINEHQAVWSVRINHDTGLYDHHVATGSGAGGAINAANNLVAIVNPTSLARLKGIDTKGKIADA